MVQKIRSISVHNNENQPAHYVQDDPDLNERHHLTTRPNNPKWRGLLKSNEEFPKHQTLSKIDQPDYEVPKN